MSLFCSFQPHTVSGTISHDGNAALWKYPVIHAKAEPVCDIRICNYKHFTILGVRQ